MSLFETFDLAGLQLPNRIVMAPMTRSRSPNGIPGDVGFFLNWKPDIK